MKMHRYLYASRWNYWNQTTPVDPVVTSFNTLSGTNLAPISAMVASIKSVGIWDKLTDIYPFAGTTITSQAVNLRNPGTNSMVFNTGGTYGVGGMTPSGAIVSTNMFATPPLMIGPNRSFSCGTFFSTLVAGFGLGIKLTGGNGIYELQPNGNVYPEIYNVDQGLSFPRGPSKMVSLSTSLGAQQYYNAGSFIRGGPLTGATGSGAVNGAIGSSNLSTFGSLFLGYTLTASEHLDMFNIFNTFNTSMGR